MSIIKWGLALGVLGGGGFLAYKAFSGEQKRLPARGGNDMTKNINEAAGAAAGAAVAVVERTLAEAYTNVLPARAAWLVDPVLVAANRHSVNPALMFSVLQWESDFGKALTMPDGTKKHEGPATARGTGDFGARPGRQPPPYGRGWGHGPFQIDFGAHRAFIDSGDWEDIYKAADYATKLMAQNFKSARNAGLTGERLVTAAVAAYNTGWGNVTKSLTAGRSPDATTTGGNYGTKVANTAAGLLSFIGGGSLA